MRLLPNSIHWCRRYPTKFNSGRDIPRDNVHELRRRPLSPCQEIGIETKLEDRHRLRFTRELCINYLIRPFTDVAWGFDTAQNVGTSDPMIVRQRPLNDHLRASFHGPKRLRDGFVCDLDSINSDSF